MGKVTPEQIKREIAEYREGKGRRRCAFCGRDVARKFRVNAARVTARHKCPHGSWCKGGSTLKAMHSNYSDCRQCRKLSEIAEQGKEGK